MSLALALGAAAQHPAAKQQDELKRRGNLAMGFDQEKTWHHFRLTPAGGVIEVGGDAATRNQIRDHLKRTSRDFSRGVFTSPIATHAETPPGVSVLRERRSWIRYAYEETPNGARILITTSDSAALTAVHDFLRYQIREHATGDPVSLQQ